MGTLRSKENHTVSRPRRPSQPIGAWGYSLENRGRQKRPVEGLRPGRGEKDISIETIHGDFTRVLPHRPSIKKLGVPWTSGNPVLGVAPPLPPCRQISTKIPTQRRRGGLSRQGCERQQRNVTTRPGGNHARDSKKIKERELQSN